MLIAQSGFGSEDAEVGLIFRVGGCDVVQVLVVHGVVGHQRAHAFAQAVVFRQREVPAVDVFGTQAEGLSRGHWCGEVQLHGMLGGFRVVLIEEVWHHGSLVVNLRRLTLLRRMTEQVREGDVAVVVA